MKHTRSILCWLLFAVPAVMFPVASGVGQELSEPVLQLAQGPNCYAIGQRIAAENGGTLAMATAESRGGQTVCRIVVVVPSRDGGRARRQEFVVPAG